MARANLKTRYIAKQPGEAHSTVSENAAERHRTEPTRASWADLKVGLYDYSKL